MLKNPVKPAREPRCDITLSTGKIVRHSIQENGSQLATCEPCMSSSEWLEYCEIVKAET